MYIYAKQKFCRFLTVSRKKRTNHTVQESLLLSNLILVRFHKSKQNRQVSSPFPAGSVCLEVFILSERYYTASAYYLSKFGRPVQKAVLDIGCTCPNIDGTISVTAAADILRIRERLPGSWNRNGSGFGQVCRMPG